MTILSRTKLLQYLDDEEYAEEIELCRLVRYCEAGKESADKSKDSLKQTG